MKKLEKWKSEEGLKIEKIYIFFFFFLIVGEQLLFYSEFHE